MSSIEYDMLDIIPPAKKEKKKAAPKKVTFPKEEKANDGADMCMKNPEWYELYVHMNDAANNFLKSLTNRQDIPDDAKDVIRGVLCLRDTHDMFFVDGSSLTAKSALFWSDALIEFAKKN